MSFKSGAVDLRLGARVDVTSHGGKAIHVAPMCFSDGVLRRLSPFMQKGRWRRASQHAGVAVGLYAYDVAVAHVRIQPYPAVG